MYYSLTKVIRMVGWNQRRIQNPVKHLRWCWGFFCQKFNSRPIVPTFHAQLTTSVSLYPFICLSYSSGYCFTSLHKRSVFILISISSDRAMCHPLSQGYGDPAYYIFFSQIKWCYYVCISFFTLLLFAKILLQMTNACANFSIFSEVFLFHEIT